MAVFIKNRVTKEAEFGPYEAPRTARSAFTQRGLQIRDYYLADMNWRDRERRRPNLIDLTEFGLENITDHFLHISAKNDEDPEDLLVSFTLNEEKGEMDRQESGRKIGRYLREFYPHLTSDQVSQLSGAINAKYNTSGLKIARTREEIRSVYERSRETCNSCMTYPMDQYSRYNRSQNVHPVEAYAGPDLAVAYTEDSRGRVTGRAVIWPERKVYPRYYAGDMNRFVSMLQKAGYRSGSIEGARMLPIQVGSTDGQLIFAMPYLDSGSQVAHYDGEFFRVGSHRELPCVSTNTSGTVILHVYECFYTKEKVFNGNDIHSILAGNGNSLYYHRRLNRDPEFLAKIQEFDGRRYWMAGPDQDYRVTYDGKRIPRRELGRTYVTCTLDGLVYPADMTVDGIAVKHFYSGDLTRCALTGTLMRRSDAYEMENGQLWCRAAFRNHGETRNGVNVCRHIPATEPVNLEEAA